MKITRPDRERPGKLETLTGYFNEEDGFIYDNGMAGMSKHLIVKIIIQNGTKSIKKINGDEKRIVLRFMFEVNLKHLNLGI